MKVNLSLYSEINGKEVVLFMTEHFSDYDGKELIDVVYQDARYQFKVELDVQPNKLELYLNDEIVTKDFQCEEDDNQFIYILNVGDMKPFFLHFGLVQLSLRIVYGETNTKFFYSPYLAVGIKECFASSENSINEMLDFIYKKEHELLYRGKPHNDSVLPQNIRNNDNSFIQEVELLKAISGTLTKQYPFFINNSNQRIVPSNDIDRFDKLHSIKSENVRYIAMHPEQLKRSYTTRAIVIKGTGYEPIRTLVHEKKQSRDTYENRCILSFIHALIRHVGKRINEIKEILTDNASNVRICGPIKSDYIVSFTVIQRYIRTTFGDHLNAFITVKKRLEELLLLYYRVLSCEFHPLTTLPRPTAVFLEVHHYRAIFEMMNMWFGFSKQTKPINYHQFHFTSADKIYEYYCLVTLYDLLIELGYIPVEEGIYRYVYHAPNMYYIQSREDNTFSFKRNNKVLTLYYQPVIYSKPSRTTNGIELFRTDRYYYAPDFIIKLIEHDKDNLEEITKVTYGIIDSKWRNRSTLINNEFTGSLHDLIDKYCFSIRKSDTLESVDFLWLLQGKDDPQENGPHFYHNGVISQSKPNTFRYSTAILQLTPDYGDKDILDAMRVFL